ncbi:hypothetical protein BDC45DRAFT_24180 [Circinella umbellata]|nr:hypothetical protein BDC45DRAFT_24180 [Circinella umbellata]
MPLDPLPSKMDQMGSIITEVSKTCLDAGSNMVYKLLSKTSSTTEEKNFYKIMEHIIEVIENYQYLLKKSIKPSMYTEQDYWQNLWSRIFSLIFRNSNVRMKAGESVPLPSTLNKDNLYSEQKNITRFKIDCRLLVDITNEEYDIIPIEVAKDDEDKKIINDMGKLIREGKDVLDNLHNNISKDHDEVFCFIIQIAGKNIGTCY